MHFSFSAANKNADENEIPSSAKKRKRKRKSPVVISQNLVTVQLRIQHCRPHIPLGYGAANANDIFGTKTKNKTKMNIHFRPKTKKAEND